MTGQSVIILCLSGILVIYQVHDAQSELENVLNTTTVGYYPEIKRSGFMEYWNRICIQRV